MYISHKSIRQETGLMDLYVWQISEASLSINPFEILTEQWEQYDCVVQKKNCWWWKLPLKSKVLWPHTVLEQQSDLE